MFHIKFLWILQRELATNLDFLMKQINHLTIFEEQSDITYIFGYCPPQTHCGVYGFILLILRFFLPTVPEGLIKNNDAKP